MANLAQRRACNVIPERQATAVEALRPLYLTWQCLERCMLPLKLSRIHKRGISARLLPAHCQVRPQSYTSTCSEYRPSRSKTELNKVVSCICANQQHANQLQAPQRDRAREACTGIHPRSRAHIQSSICCWWPGRCACNVL